MTNQQIFDKVVQHAREQGCQSIEEDGVLCLYRDKLGNKCFAGIFIPDEAYKSEMEGKPISDLKMKYNLFQNMDTEFLYDLQGIHDYTQPAGWETRFKDFAKKRGLLCKEARSALQEPV